MRMIRSLAQGYDPVMRARKIRPDSRLAAELSPRLASSDDGVAALSVWALLIPQALAYATIAGVPVQYGLYTAFAALIAYAIFGTRRQVVQGPSATVAAVSTAVITPLAGAAALGSPRRRFRGRPRWRSPPAPSIWSSASLRMGWVSNFLSRAVLAGFILGFAIGIVIDQVAEAARGHRRGRLLRRGARRHCSASSATSA